MSTDFRTAPKNESPEELHRDIRRTRGEMDQTIDELGERLNPHNLLDRFLDSLKGDGASAGKNLADSLKSAGKAAKRGVREHPVPTLLGAAGLLWYLLEEHVATDDADRGEIDASQPEHRPGRDRDRSEDWTPAWDEEYDWTSSEDEDEAQWHRRAEQTLSELQTSASDESKSPGEQLRGTASRVLALSGRRRGDLDARRPRRRGRTSQSIYWQNLSDLDAVSSDHETASDESWADQAAAAWESVKQALADSKRSTKEKLRVVSETISMHAKRTGSRASDWRDSAMAVGSEWTQSARERTSEAASYGGAQARRAGEKISSGAKLAKQRVVEATDDYPLVAAGASFGIGLVAGLLLPRTRYEDHWMGDAADEVKAAAKQQAEETAQRGKQVAAETASAAMDEAERQGITPEQMGASAKDAVSSVADSARDAANKAQRQASEVKESAVRVAEEAKQTAVDESQRQVAELNRSS